MYNLLSYLWEIETGQVYRMIQVSNPPLIP
jgi:hypothetical protein